MPTADWFLPLLYALLGALALYLWLRLWAFLQRRLWRPSPDGQSYHVHVVDGTASAAPSTAPAPDRRWLWGTLTGRELEVARLVEQGRRNAEIAQELGLSLYTVEGYLKRIYSKLGVKGRMNLVRWMHDEGVS